MQTIPGFFLLPSSEEKQHGMFKELKKKGNSWHARAQGGARKPKKG